MSALIVPDDRSPPIRRVLVCGGRDFADRDFLNHMLDRLHESMGPFDTIIEGGAFGADRLARDWAIHNRVNFKTFSANWTRDGKAAGPKRNQRMLDEGKPDYVIAFAGGRGTQDMVNRARKAGVDHMSCSRSTRLSQPARGVE